MNPAVGIDLGTTNTVVAVQTDDTGARLLQMAQPAEARNQFEYRDEIKSAVYFESAHSAVVGSFAARRLDGIRSIKSRMGTRWRMPHPYNTDITLTPAYVSGHILKAAVDETRRQFPAWDQSAILTVPASFNTDQRWDTLAAARMAGLRNVRLLDEPTAAFYHFFDQNRQMFDQARPTNVLVFDFGGGTLDVTVIRAHCDNQTVHIDPIGRSRYNSLGGDDIDLDLASFFLSHWATHSHTDFFALDREMRAHVGQAFRRAASAFKEEAEHYIQQGTDLNEFTMDEELSVARTTLRIRFRAELSREQYDLLSGRFFSHKNDLSVFRPIVQALDVASAVSSGFDRHELQMVLYTGGASRMAGSRAALAAFFSPTPCYAISDEDACNTVALGAAACRYDEVGSGRKGVTLTSRLLEAIVARNEEGTAYVPIVPLTCQPGSEFKTEGHQFRTTRQTLTLRLPLFRGKNATDHDLAPIQDVQFEMPAIVEPNVPYLVEYRMTTDKTVELAAVFADRSMRVAATLDIGSPAALTKRRRQELMQVNRRH